MGLLLILSTYFDYSYAYLIIYKVKYLLALFLLYDLIIIYLWDSITFAKLYANYIPAKCTKFDLFVSDLEDDLPVYCVQKYGALQLISDS